MDVEAVETRLLKDMLERLSNTPLMRTVQKGDQTIEINETQRVFWAIQFIKDFAADRELDLE